ncbi:hypothetical protein [Streptomyces sp. NPDC059072]|uniref:hypothetical protein n=1 Tax=Streptomyces sp. NPDC059072 TaxID=3346715 RepID=UPI0036A66BAC
MSAAHVREFARESRRWAVLVQVDWNAITAGAVPGDLLRFRPEAAARIHALT